MFNYHSSLRNLLYRKVDSCEKISAYHDYCIFDQIWYVYESSITTIPKNNDVFEKHCYYIYWASLCTILIDL